MQAFEGNRPVAVAPVDIDEPDDLRAAQHEAIRRLLDWLCEPHEPEDIGKRALYLRFWMGSGPATQADLAVRLGVTPAAVSMAIKSFRLDSLRKRPDSGIVP